MKGHEKKISGKVLNINEIMKELETCSENARRHKGYCKAENARRDTMGGRKGGENGRSSALEVRRNGRQTEEEKLTQYRQAGSEHDTIIADEQKDIV